MTHLGDALFQHRRIDWSIIPFCDCGWEPEDLDVNELVRLDHEYAEHLADMVRAYLRERPVLRQAPVEQPEDDEDPQTIAQRVKALLPPSLRAMWWGGL
jgi:hypothetical protein